MSTRSQPPSLVDVTRDGSDVSMPASSFDAMCERLLAVEDELEDCQTALTAIVDRAHDRDSLRGVIAQLVDAHHRGHDARFPWSLCSRDVCRDTAIALGVRP